MNYQAVELSVCVGGKPLHVYKDLEDDSFVEARKGSEYILRLRNKTLERVLAVVSVDGLSIMNGEQATPDSGGYILEPYETLEIPGWSLGNKSVAQFKFMGKAQSYAAQGDFQDTSNVGTIGLLVYSEKPKAQPFVLKQYLHYTPAEDYAHVGSKSARPYWSSEPFLTGGCSEVLVGTGAGMGAGSVSNLNVASAGSSLHGILVNSCQSIGATALDTSYQDCTTLAASVSNIGTQFGQESNFKTTSSSFQRDILTQTTTIYYDDARGLRIRGIEVIKNPQVPAPKGNPFPGTGCKPPIGWRK